MRLGKQNGGPTLSPLRTRSPEALSSRPPPREARREVAILDSQFQTDALAQAKEVRGCLAMRRLCFEPQRALLQWADPASEARKGRPQKKARTTRNCTVH